MGSRWAKKMVTVGSAGDAPLLTVQLPRQRSSQNSTPPLSCASPLSRELPELFSSSWWSCPSDPSLFQHRTQTTMITTTTNAKSFQMVLNPTIPHILHPHQLDRGYHQRASPRPCRQFLPQVFLRILSLSKNWAPSSSLLLLHKKKKQGVFVGMISKNVTNDHFDRELRIKFENDIK